MSPTTITISEEAYRRLKSRKKESESFSDVIIRLTEKRPLSELTDVLSEEEAENLEERIKKNRRETRDSIDDIKGRLNDDC